MAPKGEGTQSNRMALCLISKVKHGGDGTCGWGDGGLGWGHENLILNTHKSTEFSGVWLLCRDVWAQPQPLRFSTQRREPRGTAQVITPSRECLSKQNTPYIRNCFSSQCWIASGSVLFATEGLHRHGVAMQR